MKKSNLLIVFVSAVLMLPFALFGIWCSLEKEITISDGPQRTQVKTMSATVGSLLRSEKIQLNPYDVVSPSAKTHLKDGMTIQINRYEPLKVIINGAAKLIYGKNLTTREVLQKAGVTLGSEDRVNIDLDRVVKPGETVSITQIAHNTYSEVKSIPFSTIIKSTTHLLPGERRIAQNGSMGKERTVYDVRFEGGQIVKKTFVKKEVLSAPQAQIILKGRAPVIIASRGGKSSIKGFSYKHAYIMTATGYDLSFQSTGKLPGMPGYGITASGTRARVGTIAVDPNIIPLGTKLYIEYMDGTGGYGYAVAEDTGSAIKGYRLDLFFNTTREAMQFGRRQVRVYLLN